MVRPGKLEKNNAGGGGREKDSKEALENYEADDDITGAILVDSSESISDSLLGL